MPLRIGQLGTDELYLLPFPKPFGVLPGGHDSCAEREPQFIGTLRGIARFWPYIIAIYLLGDCLPVKPLWDGDVRKKIAKVISADFAEEIARVIGRLCVVECFSCEACRVWRGVGYLVRLRKPAACIPHPATTSSHGLWPDP
jgi:hypothetical protein